MSRTVSLFVLSLVLFACPGPCPEGDCDGGEPSGCDSGKVLGAPNLLQNAGFECGDALEGWEAQFGSARVETTAVRSGRNAARLIADEAKTYVHLWHDADAVTAPASGTTYCAYAWVKGTAANAHITVRRVGSNMDDNFSAPLSNSEWTRIPSESYGGLPAVAQGDSALLFRVFMKNAQQGDFLLIDDVALWESVDGKCR